MAEDRTRDDDAPSSDHAASPHPPSVSPAIKRKKKLDSQRGRRLLVGRSMRSIFGEDGVTAIKEQNWSFTSLFVGALGLVADLTQVIGPVAKWGLALSFIAAVIFALIIFRRTGARRACAVPFIASLVLVLTFGGIAIAQETMGAKEKGVLAKQFPLASNIQRALFETTERIDETTTNTNQMVSQFIERYERDHPDADTATIEAFRTAAERLANSGDARQRKALDDFASGNEDRALRDLEHLAEDQTETASLNVQQAAQTWREIGGLAYFSNPGTSLRAWTQVTVLVPGDAEAWNFVGNLNSMRSDLPVAERAYWQVIKLAEMSGDKTLIATALGNLGNLEVTRENLNEAADYYAQALDLNQQIGNKEGVAEDYSNLGVLELTRGNFDEVADYYAKALDLNQQLGRKRGMATTYGNLGILEFTRGNFDGAADYYAKALDLNQQLGRKRGMAHNYGNLGNLEATRVNLDEAADYYAKALDLNQQIGSKEGIAIQYANLGTLEEARANLAGACEHWQLSRDLYAQIGMPHMVERVEGIMRDAGCAEK